ncbi:pectin lyase-like superfamily protein [Artemisia annua]|uniref:Pectin lyase-like superfamily protein n=1 Tax=Artemisia annua TaxID=35608 RepID=A0A2U1Q6I8_ARTAN|nr:pectin lyase-like superfamily protein [Artemisia annua]
MFGSETTKVFVIFMFMVAFSHAHVFDITKFGAKHGGEISKALSEAWKCACNTPKHSKLIIPKGQFCLNSFEFKGPCKAPVEIIIDAVIIGPKDPMVIPKGKQWITFSYITGMTLTGCGTLDGLGGAMAWPSNNPKKTAHKKTACGLQYNLSFNFIQNSLISGITSKDSKNFHVNVMSCTNVVFDNFNILAPAESPNTDGIHLGWSKHITIKNSIIRTGDDCISIGDGCENLHIEGVKCGPGHGISVGSLGRNPGEKPVKGVFVKNCVFSGTANGVRIKTWPDSLPGEVADMHFEDLTMDRVEVPIIIEQDYCPHGACTKSKPSLVKVHKVIIRNIKGTATTPTVVKLRCSTANHGCENVKISDINLRYDGPHGPARQECCNVRPIYAGKMIPPPCTRF